MKTQSAGRITAIATLVATAGLAVASNETSYVPDAAAEAIVQSTASLSGQYSATIGSELVYGAGGFNTTVSVPVLLDRDDMFLNHATAWNSPLGAAGFVTTFGGGSNGSGFGALMSLDASGNAVIVNEGVNTRSNTPGAMLDNGTLLFTANFGGGQNNVEYFQNAVNRLPGSGVKPVVAGTKVFSANSGIDGASGVSFLSVATGISRTGGFFLGQSNFKFPDEPDGTPTGVNVWSVNNGSPVSALIPNFTWEAATGPLAIDPMGIPASGSQIRQTKPQFFQIDGCNDTFVVFGLGYTGSPFGGGAFGSRFFVVDKLDANAGFINYELIKADGGTSLNPTSTDQRFVTTGGTGGVNGGLASFIAPRFSVNNQGQVVAVHEDFSTSGGTTYQVRLYNPVLDNCTVTYPDFEVIASTGVVYPDGTEFTPFIDSFVNDDDPFNPFVVQSANNTPFSGVSIDDDGNITFTATDELFFENRIVDELYPDLTADVVYASNTSLYHYHADSQSLHRIVSGGQNGTELSSTGNPDLKIGRFSVENSDITDGFGASSYNNGVAALTFRNGFDDARSGMLPASGNVQDGGQLNPGTTSRQGVRGVVLVDLGAYDPNFGGGLDCLGDTNDDDIVNLDDLDLVLSNFGQNVAPGTDGDVTGEGVVNLDDLDLVLSNFGQCNEAE